MGDEFPTVRAAAVQAAPVYLDREQTLEKACDLIAEAGENGADVTVFPEGFVPGHPMWYYFHSYKSEVSDRLATRLFKNSVTVPGPVTEQLGEAAAAADTYLVMGVCEKEPNTTGTMYNSQLFFSPDGELIGKHQKIKPTTKEQLVHNEGNRETFGTVQTENGPMSGLICGENSNPLAIFALAAEHTQIHCMSWPPSFSSRARMPNVVETASRAFAQMTKAHVISANSVITDQMIEVMEADEELVEEMRHERNSGGSIIVGPKMNTIAGPLDNEEGIIYGELDLEESVSRKIAQDFAGHYNRNDLFELRINRTPSRLYTSSEPATEQGFEPVVGSNGQDTDGRSGETERRSDQPGQTDAVGGQPSE